MDAFEIKERRTATSGAVLATACIASIRAGICSEKCCCSIGFPILPSEGR
jgi:hypothetical protein